MGNKDVSLRYSCAVGDNFQLSVSIFIILITFFCFSFFSGSSHEFEAFLQEEFDTYDPKVDWFLQLHFLKKRSRIIEIVAAHDIVFALTQSGICAAFSRGLHLLYCSEYIL